MSAVGFIITVFVLKVILDLLAARRGSSRLAAQIPTDDDEAIESIRTGPALSRHPKVETGNLPSEQYGSAAGSRSMFDDGGVEPVASSSDGFSGSRYDD